MKAHRRLWFLFATGALIVMIALGWVTARVLELESREAQARGDAQYQEALRLALWRMDSWFAPRLAREAARPYFEYLSYYPQERAYTKILNEISKGEVLTPSPLLTFTSEYFPIHFQVNDDGSVTSPEVPTESQRDLAEATLLPAAQIDSHAKILKLITPMLSRAALTQRVIPAEEQITAMTCEAQTVASGNVSLNVPAVANAQSSSPAPMQFAEQPNADPSQGRAYQGKSQSMMTQEEQTQRFMNSNGAQQAAIPQPQRGNLDNLKEAATKGAATKGGPLTKDQVAEGEPTVSIGPLVPLWLAYPNPSAAAGGYNHELAFVRRVQVGDRECFQGFLVDWSRLRAALLEQVTTLLPDAQLQPVIDAPIGAQPSGHDLATVPATLGASRGAPIAVDMLSPARVTLSIAWLAALGAIFAAGLTLRASIHFGEKHSRFASAVTHELRTPLTTFRMYSEMLAEDMVQDEWQRKAYLETLKSESTRLATLVENVLSYARLEEGRFASHAQKTTLAEVFARLTPILDRRAKDAGMELKVGCDGDSESPPHAMGHVLHIDTEAIGQILFNLVDNACKYANGDGTHDRTIHIDATQRDGRVRIVVRDHGPGVRPEHARAIFAPFERGSHGAGDTIPGVGLGLALARGMARDMGGDLTLDGDGQQRNSGASGRVGACFVLDLPARASQLNADRS